MARLQSIENRIYELGGNEFQELCDIYLQRINTNYNVFARTGSQTGKKQTTKGTPDSFFQLPNGKFIFVEHTVNESDKDKLENDVKSCLDVEKTKIPIEKIQEIILCTTRKVTPKQIDELNVLLGETYIQLTVYYLQRIAIDLMLNYNDLVHQYLDLPLDTGQIVSIEKFIEEYERASQNIATTLNNEFFHRESEMKEVENSIKNFDFSILTGNPGVGKTKLAIESIKQFLSKNTDYYSLCISYKGNARLIDDLPQYFDSEKNYIIFVDDANRIDAFDQILGFYKFSRKGNLKLLITVRDYALEEIRKRCFDYKTNIVAIDKFTDEQLTDILKSDSFGIKNSDYHREILRIAIGNPRIAIMTARLAIEKQNINALSDVTDLFDKYFSTFIKDADELTNQISLKCLGLIAFFHSIPYKEFETVNPILSYFGIDYNDFIETIDKLDKLELVEIQFDYVKIPEQNLATYFFYKAFIKDEVLSFKSLFFNYYENNNSRFKDTIIPANNTFNREKVMDKVIPSLKDFIIDPKRKDSILKIFKDFWFYLQDETLNFIYDKINIELEPEETNYSTNYDLNQFSYEKDEILELLKNFYVIPTKLIDSLELSFEYARKVPEKLPELIYNIREYLTFKREDQYTGFIKQKSFIDWLLTKFESENEIYLKAFFAIANDFLKHQYIYQRSDRINTLTFCTFNIELNEPIKEIRTTIWNAISQKFNSFSSLSLIFLNEYSNTHPCVSHEIMKFDLSYVLDIISNELTADSFEHCVYIQQQLWWWKRQGIETSELNNLKSTFTNPLYEFYIKISWDRLRDKFDYDFDNRQEYDKIKENDIRSTFCINSIQEFELLYGNLTYIYNWNKKNRFNIERSVRIIIDENLTKKIDLGLQILKLIIINNNDINYLPYGVLGKLLNNIKDADIIYTLFVETEYKNCTLWLIMYFEYLDKSIINENHYNNLIALFKSINESIYLDFNLLSKYEIIDPNFFSNILGLIVERNDNGARIILENDYYQKYLSKISHSLPLVKKSYLQQEILSDHFDYEGKCLLKILKLDNSFLYDYIILVTKNDNRIATREYTKLSVVWELENTNDLIKEAFNLIVEKMPYFGIDEHFSNSFFTGSKIESNKVDEFINYYIDVENSMPKRMNAIFDVIRYSKSHLFEKSILKYLSLNNDIENFKKISWNGNGGTFNSEVNIGDLEASQWNYLLTIVEKSTIGLKTIPIKKYIKDRIDLALKYAEIERKRKFLRID